MGSITYQTYLESLNLKEPLNVLVNKVDQDNPNYLRFLVEFLINKKVEVGPKIEQKIWNLIEERKSPIEKLPREIKERIFGHLDPSDLEVLSHVSSEMRKDSDQEILRLIKTKMGRIFDLGIPEDRLRIVLQKYGEQVTFLDFTLTNNDIILEFINYCPNLSHLFIHDCRIDVIELSKKFPSGLQLLELAGVWIDPESESASELAKGLPSGLKSLALYYNHIGDAGASDLAKGLPSSLEYLYLFSNNIWDTGAKALAEGLPSSLQFLDLSSNEIGDEGAFALVSKRPSSLKTLHVSNNRISTDAQGILRSYSQQPYLSIIC